MLSSPRSNFIQNLLQLWPKCGRVISNLEDKLDKIIFVVLVLDKQESCKIYRSWISSLWFQFSTVALTYVWQSESLSEKL